MIKFGNKVISVSELMHIQMYLHVSQYWLVIHLQSKLKTKRALVDMTNQWRKVHSIIKSCHFPFICHFLSILDVVYLLSGLKPPDLWFLYDKKNN